MGYHVTDIGTHYIVPDIDPDIRYEVYDIGDRMTRYRVFTRHRYPISGHMRHVPISGQMKTPISEHMTRYRVTIGPDIGFLTRWVFDPISGKNPISGMARFQMSPGPGRQLLLRLGFWVSDHADCHFSELEESLEKVTVLTSSCKRRVITT
jgi:hypothetical protein